jgi:streptogrisin D
MKPPKIDKSRKRRLGAAVLALALLSSAAALGAGGARGSGGEVAEGVGATRLGLAGRAAEALGRSYAGASERRGGELVVQAASAPKRAEADLGPLADRVELERVPLSADRLGAAARAVLAALRVRSDTGAAVHTSPARGAVVVAASLSPAQEEALAAAASPARLVVRPPARLRLAEGGRQLLVDGRFFCTSAYDVADAAGTQYGLTAGHCGRRGDSVAAPNGRLGSIVGTAFWCCRVTRSDSAIYSVPPEYPNGLVNTGRGVFPVSGAFANGSFFRGMRICYYGRTSRRERCGEVIRTNVSVIPGGGGGRTVRALFCINDGVRLGDSGGPAYQPGDDGLVAAGIVSLGNSRAACFSKIQNALERWGVSLIPAS